MKKFSLKQIRKRVGSDDNEFIEKVFLLANGMIDVHGFDTEKAYQQALDIATSWRENGGNYSRRGL
ncbi:MAG: hypothetical protein AAFQ20_08095 [Bacteroidota bacterium]